jgi:hypothetical protein
MLLFIVLLLLPVSALAQTAAPNQQNVLVIPNALGATVYKPDMSSIDIVGTQPNNQMYFSHDRYGRNNGDGFINKPFVDRPLDATTLSPHNYSGYLPLPELPRR